MTWALDLDGVVWRGDVAIPGSAAAVERLRARGERVVFLTNNSWATVEEYVRKLEGVGVPAAGGDLVTSAQAAARLVEPRETALVCAGPGVEQALRERGARPVRRGRADAVVVGWHRDFDYERLREAMTAVRAGARLIGTNDDATYPMPEGELPGGGALLAAVAYASEVAPTVAGKPHPPMVELVRERVGPVEVVVGDRPSTDGVLARRLGARFVLVASGVTSAGDRPLDPAPDELVDDLAAAVPA